MLCDEIIAFNVEDKKTFQSSTILEEFFSMKLSRFVVSHQLEEEEHVNVVIVDHDGKYRGHKDGYISKKSLQEKTEIFQVFADYQIDHDKIDVFLIINLSAKRIYEYINVIHVKLNSLTEKIDFFIKENQEIFEILPEELVYKYASRNFYLLKVVEDIFCCVSLKNDSDNMKNIFFKLFNNLKVIIKDSDPNSPILNLIFIILKISNLVNFNEQDLSYIQKILNSDEFFSELQINPEYKERIQILKKNFAEDFVCSEIVLNPMLQRKTTIIDIFSSNIDKYKCIIDFIQYLKRRKLFLF
jgi:hypothetical protein